MAKGQKALQTTATTRDAEQYGTAKEAQSRLVEGSQEFKDYSARTADRRKTIEDGTFAESKDFLSNRDAVAARKSQRDASLNMADTGFGALGARYADPNQLAITNAITKDEFARDSAMQAEADKRAFVGQTEAQENDVVNKRIGVDSSVMSAGFNQANYNFSQAAQIAATRASLVPGLIGAALGATGQVAGAYMGRPPG